MNHAEVIRDAQAFLGPEIVSPHYENFFHSRRWGLSFLAGFGVLQLLANSRDIQHFAVSATAPYLFWTFTFYFFLETKYSLLKPLLFRFHNEIIDHETSLLMADWNDSMREFLQKRMDEAKEQLEYYNVHQDYYSIKSESINRVVYF